jgi:LuxR family maltose regulon positive regulatory protein
MQRPNFFLRTKLLPPRPVPELLARPRLTRRLQGNLNAPITIVTADAGCGKTTLISEFVRQLKREVVWYQLDHTDADPFVFLGYICHGIKRFVPNFGETLLPYLNEATDDLLRYPERAVDLLLNEILESIEQPFILVLDDYHHLGRETIVHKLVDRLLAYSSDMLHVIITSRDLPPLAIVRRRSQGGATVITRDDLLFTDEETHDLFRQTLEVELKPEEIKEYRERTHGWATALQLVRQVAEAQLHTENGAAAAAQLNLHELLQRTEKDIFDYFAEEVFAQEENETQQLLLRLALLDALPLEVCSQLYPEMRPSAVLPLLVQRNVFLTVAGDRSGDAEAYRLHPLFRDFLQRRLRAEVGRTGVSEEHKRIAEFFLERGRWEQSVEHFLRAEDFNRAAQIIAQEGEYWLESGAIITLGVYADKIPNKFLEAFPRSLVYKAEVARLQGESEKTSTLLHRAVKLLHEKGDREGEAESLHSLASIARRNGDCIAAENYLTQAEQFVGEDSEIKMKCENTRGLCLIARGAWTQAERHFRVALEIAERLGNERYVRLVTHNLGIPSGLRGDFGESLRWLGRILDDEKRETQLPQEAIGHLNVARMHLFRGEFPETERHLERSLELCQLYNLKSLRGEVFEAYGNFYREKRDFAHAAEFYERARKAYQDAGIAASSRELDEERAALLMLTGEAPTARRLLENLVEARQKSGNEIGIYTAQLNLCRVRLANKEAVEIIPELENILTYFHEQNLYYYEAQGALVLAATYFAQGKRMEMLLHIRRALDLAARFDYDYWLRSEVVRNPRLFIDEEVTERLPLDLRDEVQKSAESQAPSAAPKLEQTADSQIQVITDKSPLSTETVDLTLKLIGHVEIYRDPTRPFAPDAWTTRRARDIFCYIATSKHRRVEKDLLIEAFWGDADFEAIEKNFHPTISHIRKALNSRQTFKQNFIMYRDGAYQLNPELSYFIDTEEFDRYIAEAEKAKREGDDAAFRDNLELAHKLYRGDFMSGVYDAWVDELRGYYSEQYARILNGLAKISFKEKNWSQTVKLANEILQADPYREDVHRLLMRVYAAQGKRGAVKEQFEKISELLKKELGVEPSPETRRSFQELFK